MAFFGPGGLSGASSTPGLDPELRKALLAQFPGLESLGGQPGQGGEPRTLQTLGYQWPGPTLYAGQGTGAFQLSPFESASGVSPESITGGLAQGTFGKSGSQSPLGTSQQQGSSLLSLPSLSLPMAQTAATQGAFGDDTMGGSAPTESGGITISAGDVLGAADTLGGIFSPGTGTAFDPTGETQTPAYQDYRAGERDMSTLGGSFLGNLSGSQLLAPQAPLSSFLGLPGDTTFSAGGDIAPGLAPQSLPWDPNTTFSMPGAGETMTAPGGSAQAVLGPEGGYQGDLLGGGLSTLQGLLALYGGSQTGDIGQLLGGAAGTLGGVGQMAPETLAALSQQLGLGAGGLGLAAGGLGGLAGAYGLYQGIEQGDPMQALMGAGGLYAGAAPIVNALAGTSLPTLTGALGALAAKLGLTGGAAAGGAAAGAGAAGAGAAGAGAGAAGGATAATAMGPLAMAMGPYIVGKLFEMGVEMTEGKEQAARTGSQYSKLMGDLPHQINSLQSAPGLIQQLEGATPEQAAQIFAQLQGMQDTFGGSGMENFLRQGQTSSQYGDFAKGIHAKFPESQQVYSALSPFLGAVDLGRIRAQDIAQRGGINVPGAFTPEQAAQMLGIEGYSSSEAGSPGAYSTRAANPWVQQQYFDPQTQVRDTRQQQIDDFYNTVQQQWQEGGMGYRGDPRTDLETRQQAMERFPELGGMGPVAGPGWSQQAQQAFAGIQPGGIEQGLSQLFGGQFSPSVQPWLNMQPQVQQALGNDPMLQQLQQFTQQMGGLTQNADPIMQAIQQNLQGAPVGGVLPQEPGAPGFTSTPGGGGMDLMALLRQLGYVQ